MDHRFALVARAARWLWLLALVACGSAHAIGSVPPLDNGGTQVVWRYDVLYQDTTVAFCGPYDNNYTFTSPTAAASAHLCPNTSGHTYSLTGFSDTVCNLPQSPAVGTKVTCNGWVEGKHVGTTTNYSYAKIAAKAVSVTTQPTCPSNSTLSGSSCTCNLGYHPNAAGTACVAYTCSPRELGSLQMGPYSTGSAAMAPKYWCDTSGQAAGCTVKFKAEAAFEGASGWWAQGSASYTGGECQGTGSGGSDGSGSGGDNPPGADLPDDTGPPDQNPCPDGEVPSTVNGQTVCYKAPNGMTPADTTQHKDASGNPTGSTETQTTCSGGECTTTTTNKDGAGNTTGTDTETEDQASYCSEHPGSALCSGEDKDTGGECDDGVARVGCMAPGNPVDNEVIDSVTQPMSITPSSGFGPSNAACPAPRTVQLTKGISIAMPFDLLCDFANKIRPVVIALAWLAAAASFLGLARRGD